jgi:hypothetical protein
MLFSFEIKRLRVEITLTDPQLTLDLPEVPRLSESMHPSVLPCSSDL